MLQDEFWTALEDGRRCASRATDSRLTETERRRSAYLGWAVVFDIFQLWSLALRAWADELEIDRKTRQGRSPGTTSY